MVKTCSRARTWPALAALAVTAVLAGPAPAQSPTWAQVGLLDCRVDPSIGFIIAGHQSMQCRFSQNPQAPVQHYEGAINTIGIDIGISAGGRFAWGVFAPTTGVPAGALAGEYVGASADAALGLGVGANVLVGGSNRSVALQPLSLEGSVAVAVTLGVSSLKLRPVR